MQLGNFPNNNAISLARINPIHIYRIPLISGFLPELRMAMRCTIFPLKTRRYRLCY